MVSHLCQIKQKVVEQFDLLHFVRYKVKKV